MNNKKKILVAVPGYAGIQPECQAPFLRMFGWSCRELQDEYDIAPGIIYKTEQFRARNELVRRAIGGHFDYVLFLDDDMFVPRNLLASLLSHAKDVVGALYYQRSGLYNPVVMRRKFNDVGIYDTEWVSHSDPIIAKPGLYEVDVIGGGCMLFRTGVFKSLTPPYFRPESETAGTDIQICCRLQDVGYKIWIDTSLELGHKGEPQIITSANIPSGAREVTQAKEDLLKDVCEYLNLTRQECLHYAHEAGPDENRQDRWHDKERKDWPDIRDFYTEYGNWQIFNLLFWNLADDGYVKRYFITRVIENLVKKDSVVAEYGPGIGHTTIPMAKKAKTTHVYEIKGAPTLEFLKWRMRKHNAQALIHHLWDDEVSPFTYGEVFDGVVMISVINHLMKPYEVIAWFAKQIKVGGWFFLEYHMHNEGDDNPQHLDNFDVGTFDSFMQGLGFRTSAEAPFLFYKEKSDVGNMGPEG